MTIEEFMAEHFEGATFATKYIPGRVELWCFRDGGEVRFLFVTMNGAGEVYLHPRLNIEDVGRLVTAVKELSEFESAYGGNK